MFVAPDLQAPSVGESVAFVLSLKKLRHGTTTPSRKYHSSKLLTEHCTKIYTNICYYINLAPQVCWTLDIWSNRQMRTYLDVTGHFIVNFKLQSVMLSCLHFHGPHNVDIIFCYFEDIVTSFQITGKVYRCITDNASNMKKGFVFLVL